MSTARRVWQVAWKLAVCLLLLVWVAHGIFLGEGKLAYQRSGGDWSKLSRGQQWEKGWTHGPAELANTIRQLRPAEGLASLVFMGATIFLGMLRWRMVLKVQNIHLSVGRATEISLVAQFFNSFLLGSTGGDLLKAYYAARETHHLKAEAVVTVLVDRLIGLLSMLVFAAIMMIPNAGLLASHRRLSVLAAFVGLMLAGAGGLTAIAFWGGLSKRWPAARGWLRRLPKAEALERSLGACRKFGEDKRFLANTFGLSMVLNLFCVLQIWVLAGGLGLSIRPVTLLVIVPIIICIAALPITPSGLGVRENLYVWMLAVPEIDVGATQALSLSLLAYGGFLIWSLVGGVVYVMFRERHHLDEMILPGPEAR